MPVASPSKAVLGEEAIGEVVAVYLEGEAASAVGVGLGGGGLDDANAVGAYLDLGVVEGVEVNGQAAGME